MRFLFTIFALLLSALALPAGTIDPIPVNVSTDTTQWLNPQDALLFTVSEWSYTANAPLLDAAAYPAHVTFELITAPGTDAGDFTAVLESRDGTVAVGFPGTLSWQAGYIESASYNGLVSVLCGSIDLSAALSAELFTSSSAVLVLENQGAKVDAGLPPRTLEQDLGMSFSSGGFSVGGEVTGVRYLDPPAAAPEPNPGWLLAAFGVLWFALSKVLGRWSRRRIAPK
jgi:hypothetical protein